MNSLIHLKGRINYLDSKAKPANPQFRKGECVTLAELKMHERELEYFLDMPHITEQLGGVLVSVHYKRVIPKSRRLSYYFSNGNMDANDAVVGAKFGLNDAGNKFHIITYFIGIETIREAINKVKSVIDFMNYMHLEKADEQFLKILYAPNERKKKQERGAEHNASEKEKQTYYLKWLKDHGQSKTALGKMLVETSEIHTFKLPTYEVHEKGNAVVTIYKTKKNTIELMNQLGITISQDRIVNDTTMLLYPDEILKLRADAPYLIAMAVSDFCQYHFEDTHLQYGGRTIPSPRGEPVIGVIDAPFDMNAYCAEWVEYHQVFPDDISVEAQALDHGTEVSSLIVDGESFNPSLADGCGRFRVRHFGVIAGKRGQSFSLLKSIREIVEGNPDIKVWNLSLGSQYPIHENYISPVAALLDQLQYMYDIIFVIAGTNDPLETRKMPMGDPADSINSMVVNSVRKNGLPASYTRVGPVLSFFRKPDISYYGGDRGEWLGGCTGFGKKNICGTSFAAPLITRKMAYMIYNLHLPREVAKALLLDTASGWESVKNFEEIGFGVPPIHIQDIVKCKDDEIRFFFYERAKKYQSVVYNIPVPKDGDTNKYPYIAKATLCYMPLCDRSQGVDYTNTELDIHFGRVGDDRRIKTINDNRQTESGDYTKEEDARNLYRKWDNVKHIVESYNPRKKSKKAYEGKMWGLDIKLKERLSRRYHDGLRYGVVITLKALDGKNRCNEFMSLCASEGWLVVPVDVEQQIQVQQLSEENVRWDD